MTYYLIFLALALIGGGWLALRKSRTLQEDSGLPSGRLVYADTAEKEWQVNNTPFYSATYHLTGKPDYLIKTKQGIIPVEIKSAKAPAVPYLGHILQLAAYCLLVEEQAGRPPPHGLLKYADALYEVDFTPELRQELLDTMAEMRQGYTATQVRRDHTQPQKCRACGYFAECGEALY